MALLRYVVDTSTEIAAPADVVFGVITRKAEWHLWSTLLKSNDDVPLALNGPLALGLRTREASYDFVARVTVLGDGIFEWVARTGVPGVMDGRHRFEVTALTATRARLRNVEFYTGLLVPLVRRTASMRAAPQGFAQMNAEITARALSLLASTHGAAERAQ